MSSAGADGPETLSITTSDGVRHLRLQRPERLNALTPMQHRRVIDALADAGADADVRVVALSGAGRAFCAGEDVSGDRLAWPADRPHEPGPALIQEATAALRTLGKPTVAVLHGHTIGSGYDYAIACDFRLATPDCVVADLRVRRGLWGAEGWTYVTPRLIGLAPAARLGLLGERLIGAEGYEIGLVHELLDPADPLAAAQPFLARLAALPAEAYRQAKHELLAAVDAVPGTTVRPVARR